MEPELLVKELLENHQKDKDLTGPKVQEEVKKLRKKYDRIVKELEDDEQLVGLDWTNADLEEYNLMNIKLSDYNKEAVFKNANLKLATLTGSLLKNANFEGAELQGVTIKGRKSVLDGANLSGASVASATLNGVSLRGAKLRKASLAQADLLGADLTEARLEGADLWKTYLQGAILFNANLTNTNLDETDLRYANLYRTRFDGSNLQYARLSSNVIKQRDIHEIKKTELNLVIDDLKKEKIDKETLRIIYNNLKLIPSQKDKYNKANQIYKEQKIVLTQKGYYDIASDFHYREADAYLRSLKGLKNIYRKIIYILFKLLAGYGEKWWRPLFWIIGFIGFFGIFFWWFNGLVEECYNVSLKFLDYIYFSVVTFTTLGFGDFQPKNSFIHLSEIDIPIFRLAAATEAIIGAMLIALFIAVLAKRILR